MLRLFKLVYLDLKWQTLKLEMKLIHIIIDFMVHEGVIRV
ncbi:hypothetical protein EMIT0P44_130006 [Pseudomonas sp. IT-P44]